MPTRALRRRLDGLRTAATTSQGGAITIVYPDEWPEAARTAYEAALARGNQRHQADILHAQTGIRPAFAPADVGPAHPNSPLHLIIIRSRPDGPQ